jgi:hypothetical protein
VLLALASALPLQGLIMKPAAAFVLLLAIAGAPVTTLVCIGWCAPNAVPVDVSCHHHGSGAGVAVNTDNDACADLLATSPYLKEETQPTGTVMPASAPYAIPVATGEALLVPVHDVASAIPYRAAPLLVLRL